MTQPFCQLPPNWNGVFRQIPRLLHRTWAPVIGLHQHSSSAWICLTYLPDGTPCWLIIQHHCWFNYEYFTVHETTGVSVLNAYQHYGYYSLNPLWLLLVVVVGLGSPLVCVFSPSGSGETWIIRRNNKTTIYTQFLWTAIWSKMILFIDLDIVHSFMPRVGIFYSCPGYLFSQWHLLNFTTYSEINLSKHCVDIYKTNNSLLFKYIPNYIRHIWENMHRSYCLIKRGIECIKYEN
jgi:hypothetical protein